MRSNYPAPGDCIGIRLLACLAIATSVAGFFWLYQAVAHREALIFPGKPPLTTSSEALAAPFVPDMASAALALGNADVPVSSIPPNSKIRREASRRKHTKTAGVPKKPRTHVAKTQIRSQVRAAYAQGSSTFGFNLLGAF
jgi:hypothetical protein